MSRLGYFGFLTPGIPAVCAPASLKILSPIFPLVAFFVSSHYSSKETYPGGVVHSRMARSVLGFFIKKRKLIISLMRPSSFLPSPLEMAAGDVDFVERKTRTDSVHRPWG